MKKLNKSILHRYSIQDFKILEDIASLSHLSLLELGAVLCDIKPAQGDTITWNKELKQNLVRIQEKVSFLHLKMAQSRVKYIVNSPRGIFEEVPLNDPREGKIILAISKSLKKAETVVDYYHQKMLDSVYGRKFGKLMGYPNCCLDFGDYLNNNNCDRNNFGYRNPALESLKRSKKFVWQLNVFTNSCLPYYPCSLDCRESINYVNDLLRIFDYADPVFSQQVRYYLKEPVSLYWSCVDKIFLFGDFRKYKLGTGEVLYNKIESNIQSDTYYEANDPSYLKMLHTIEYFIKKGNKLIVSDDYLEIYRNNKKIAKVKKTNKYIPVLVKPDNV